MVVHVYSANPARVSISARLAWGYMVSPRATWISILFETKESRLTKAKGGDVQEVFVRLD